MTMTYVQKETLQFLADLRKNNNRKWFEANKPRFLEAKTDFENLTDKLIVKITTFDSDIAGLTAKQCVLRIYRDTRFSKDKTPYKSSFNVHLLAGGRKAERSRAGYYVQISPGDSFLAGGAHTPPTEWMAQIRGEIDSNGDDLRRIISAKSFKKYFSEIEGEKLKTAPRGYPKDHPEIELLKYKSFLAVHHMSDAAVTSPGFLKHAGLTFKAMHPFGQFLNRGSE